MSLLTDAQGIKNAVAVDSNTAIVVGTVLEDIVNELGTIIVADISARDALTLETNAFVYVESNTTLYFYDSPNTTFISVSASGALGDITPTSINIGSATDLRLINIRGTGSDARIYVQGVDATSFPGIEFGINDGASKAIIRAALQGTDGAELQFYNEADGGVITKKMALVEDDLIFYTSGQIKGLADPTLDTDAATKAYVDANSGSGITDLVQDTTPQLGGNLDLNGNTVGDATAADLTKLNGITATVTELNYVDGVTSSIQTQIDGLTAGGFTAETEQTGTSYTLQASDNGKIIPFNNVSDITISEPASPSANYSVTFFQKNVGKAGTDFTVGEGAVTTGNARTSEEGNYMTIWYDGTNWFKIGGELYTYSSGGTATVAVAASDDDAKETISNTIVNTTDTGNIWTSDNIFAMRFTGLNIPDGATITNAQIQVMAQFSSASTPASAVITCEKGGNPAAFVAGTNANISGRTQTTATHTWSSIPAWVDNQKDADTQSSSFHTVLQEVIDDPAYDSSHAIVVIANGDASTNTRRFATFDDGVRDAPEITVTWTI